MKEYWVTNDRMSEERTSEKYDERMSGRTHESFFGMNE